MNETPTLCWHCGQFTRIEGQILCETCMDEASTLLAPLAFKSLPTPQPAQGDGGRWQWQEDVATKQRFFYRPNGDGKHDILPPAETADYLNALEDRNRELEAERDDVMGQRDDNHHRAETGEAEAARWRALAERAQPLVYIASHRAGHAENQRKAAAWAVDYAKAMKESGR